MSPAARRPTPRGLSLLEVMVSLAIMALLMTPVIALLQTSQQVWADRDGDAARMESAHALLRHLIRHVRQAQDVVAISPAPERHGRLTLRMADNRTLTWEHAGNTVTFGKGPRSSILAVGIDELRFEAFESDGVTQPAQLSRIRLIKVHIRYRLDRDAGAERTMSASAWMRAF